MKKRMVGVTVIEILIPLIIIVIVCLAIMGPTLFSCVTCNQQTKDIGFSHKWGIWSGCMIEVNGSWMPLDNYRYFEGDK